MQYLERKPLQLFHAGTLSWSNWNLKMLVFVEGTKPSTESEVTSLRSRREWVPARTSVPNASVKSRSGREKNHSRQLHRLRSFTFQAGKSKSAREAIRGRGGIWCKGPLTNTFLWASPPPRVLLTRKPC